jgi:hypothetical protein
VKPESVTQFSPLPLQRSPWNENVFGCVPVHVPCDARSVSSTWGVPEIVRARCCGEQPLSGPIRPSAGATLL